MDAQYRISKPLLVSVVQQIATSQINTQFIRKPNVQCCIEFYSVVQTHID